MYGGGGLFPVVYVIVGAFVAAAENYLDHVGSLGRIASAVVAILIWPLILLGVDIRIT